MAEAYHSGIQIEMADKLRYEYHARTSQDYPKMNPAHIVRLGFSEPGGPPGIQSMERTDLRTLDWVHDGAIIEDVYRAMIDYDDITEAEVEEILERWRRDRRTGEVDAMKVIGQVGPALMIIGVGPKTGDDTEAVMVDVRTKEVRGPRSLYSITGRMNVEDVTLHDASVTLALKLAEQHMNK